MSRIDGGNRPASPSRRPETERTERSEAPREKKPGTSVRDNPTLRNLQGRSDFEPSRPAPRAPVSQAPAQRPVTPADAESIAQADEELGLLAEFPDQDAQGGMASAMLHAHADAPVSQNRIVERLKQDGRLEALFGEVFREGNPYVEQPHRAAIVRALDTALARGTVTNEDLRAFARGAYAQEWKEIGAALGDTAPAGTKKK